MLIRLALLSAAIFLASCACADDKAPPPAAFDEHLAQSLGADAHGMRNYVLVILKTGPQRMPAGPARDAMFRGHFANIKRLADEGKLALAGPFEDGGDWRGLFLFAVADIDEAKKLVATDPVIVNGEMVAEYRKFYGSAALMLVPQDHQKLVREPF